MAAHPPGRTMGTYRTLYTTLACVRCGASFTADVQFKTGRDREMPKYQVGDVAADVAPGVYEGIAGAYCAPCMSRWIADERRAHFEILSDDIAAGSIVARRAAWRSGALDGHPERGLVATVRDAAPIGAAAVRALADVPEHTGWPSITAWLHTAGVALWLGEVRLYPSEDPAAADATAWWLRRWDDVAARLRALGWPYGDVTDVDVAVRVDGDHRVRVAPG